MRKGIKYKGLVSTKLKTGGYVVDLFNSEGVLDWMEDIDPVILDLSDIPAIKEGCVIEFCKNHANEINILTIQV